MKQTWWKRYEPRWVRLAPRAPLRGYPRSHVTVMKERPSAIVGTRWGGYRG